MGVSACLGREVSCSSSIPAFLEVHVARMVSSLHDLCDNALQAQTSDGTVQTKRSIIRRSSGICGTCWLARHFCAQVLGLSVPESR